MLSVFLKLLIAHLLGDFVFQTKLLVAKRKENILYLFFHVLIHGLLLCLLFFQDLAEWWIAILFVSASHLAIDCLKILGEKKWPDKAFWLFIVDQVLHVLVIAAVVYYVFGVPIEWITFLMSVKFQLYFIAFLLTAVVSPILLRIFFSKWQEEQSFDEKRNETLIDAGLLIGIMERLIIVLFIQVGFLSGIGFLLAAKSIFRFGDLTNAKNTKFTEYVLVGTLASFLIAIMIGYGLRLALRIPN